MKVREERAEPLDKTTLIYHLRIQLDILRDCCALYDAGKLYHAAELATKIRVIIHNQGSCRSLLHQLKLEHIQFIDTANEFEENNLAAFNGLACVGITYDEQDKSVTMYEPKLNLAQRNHLIEFQSWWNGKTVVADGMKLEKDPSPRITFTRSRLVLCIAEMDGGAHVDQSITKDYHELRNNNLMGWFYGKGIPLQNPVPATIRQIAYEVLSTFDRIDIAKESRLQ